MEEVKELLKINAVLFHQVLQEVLDFTSQI